MLATLAAACASDSTAPAVVASVQVTPPNAQTPIGGSVQLVATPRDASGRNLSGRTVTWSSANPAVATVDGFGMVTGASLGTVQITATSEGKSGWTSVTVLPGPAAQLVFTVQPGTVAAGAPFAPAIQVTARDAFGNTATGFANPITLSIGPNPEGALLLGSRSVHAVAGIATFSAITVDTIGVGYTLQAEVPGLPPAVSAPFTVIPGSATELVFSIEPRNAAAGATIAPPVEVRARDGFGNTATAFTGAVSLVLGNNPSGGTLDGTTTASAVAGVATFEALRIDRTGGYSLIASATGLAPAASASFDIFANAPHHLAFVVPPATTAAGAPFTPALQVEIRDSLENRDTNATHAVTLAIGTNPAGGVLSGTTTRAAVAGVATFPGLSIDAASAGYTLTAAATGLGGATSAPFTITAGAVSTGQSTVTAAPSSIEASDGANQSIITVTARDAFGNPVAGVPVVLAATGGGNTLTQPGLTDASGVATGTLSATAAGSKSVSATVAGVAITQTASVTVTAGAISQGQSTIVAAPASIVASSGTDQSTITVTARDAFGNPVAGAAVVLAASGAGNTLTQPAGPTGPGGVATGILSSTVAQSKTVTATIGGTAITQTANVTVTPAPATALAFTVQPSDAVAGAAITPAVQVTARDAFGNTATGFTGTVTLAIATNPPGTGVLDGTTSVAAAAGVASLPGVDIDEAGAGYTLTASATGLADALSTAFDITTGGVSAARSTAAAAPATITASNGASQSTITVTARDDLGNPISGATVVLSVSGTGNTLTQPAGPTGAGGVAIGTLSATVAQSKTVTATIGGTAINQTATVTVEAAAVSAGQSTIGAAPASIVASSGTNQSTITVTARDAFGNPVAGATVVLAASGAGNTLTQPAGPTDANGVATGTLSSTVAGGKTVSATVSGVVVSQTANVAVTPAPATALAFTVQPSDAVAGTAITPAVQVTARDAFGNTATAFTGTVTLAIATNPPGTGVLDGTASVAAVAGIATFPGLNIDEASAGYTLTAAAPGLTGATSAPFDITAGAVSASQSTIGAAPASIVASSGTNQSTITVTARDAFGNPVAGATVVLAAGGGGNTLTQPAGPTGAGGVATGTLSSTTVGSRTVSATVGGVAVTETASVTVTPAPATRLAFTVQPSDATAGAAITPAVQVTAQDLFGNTATDFTGTVTLALGTNPPGTGVLDGTIGVAAVAGIAAFPGVNIDEAGAGYTLTASATGLSGATSNPFTISAGAAARLAFTVQPSDAVAGAAITPAVQVTARDAFGNTATGFTGTVTLAIATNPPGTGVLDGTTTVAAVAGIATFPGLNIDEASAGYTLTAGATGLSGDTTAPFTIAVGAAANLALVSGNAQTDTIGATLAAPHVVRVTDAVGNGVSGATVTWAVTGGGSITPSSITNAAGEAQATRVLGTTAGPQGATASVAGLAGSPVSFTATASAGTTTRLAFTVQPSTAGAGAAITPAVQIAARDGHGNTATSFTGTVCIAIGDNPAGGTLSGTVCVAAVAGTATFPTLSIDNVGTGYTLTATSAGLTSATSAVFDVLTGISPTLSTVTAATDTVGQCLRSCQLGLDASRITVTVRDVGGNPVAGVPVTLAATSADSVLFTNPGASGVTDANGVFAADFRSGQAGAKVVTAVAGGTSLSQAPTVHVMPVLVGAGDIATCTVLSDDAVAALLDSIPGTVFTLGDNAYEHGTATEFTSCYDPTWGRHKARTHAVAGNRDYDTPGATGHYGYFGAAANPSGGTGNDAGFYSFDLGAWHIIALNTEVATASNSAQMAWLLQDLDGRRDQCVIAMWHKPMFGSSSAGSGSAVPLWQASADSGVDIVLNGHAHIYERLAPMDASGNLSAAGTREFIVGTGGISLGGFGSDPPYVETRDKTTHGVLRIVLYPGRYRWQFIPAPGFGSFTDSGTTSCN